MATTGATVCYFMSSFLGRGLVHRCLPGRYQIQFETFLPSEPIPAIAKISGLAACDVQDNSDDSDLEDSLPDRLQLEERGTDCVSLSDSEHVESQDDSEYDSEDEDYESPVKYTRRPKGSPLPSTIRKPKAAGKRPYDSRTIGQESLSASYSVRARLRQAAEDEADPIEPFTQSPTQLVSYLDDSPPAAKGGSKQAKGAKAGSKQGMAPKKKKAERFTKAKKPAGPFLDFPHLSYILPPLQETDHHGIVL